MFNTPDIPSDESCKTVNPELFLYFQKIWLKKNKSIPGSSWTEAEVVQWLDTEYDKYLHDNTLDTIIR